MLGSPNQQGSNEERSAFIRPIYCEEHAPASTLPTRVGTPKPKFCPFSPQDGGTSCHGRERELIEPNKGDKRYVRRDEDGQFTEDQVDIGRSQSADNNQDSKGNVPKGQGDRGDHKE
jgi:hypothetical protein